MTSPLCTAERHGDTATAYRYYGCRCAGAREARRLYAKRLRDGRHVPALVESLGVRRRLHALAAIGWSAEDIAVRLGKSRCAVSRLRNSRDRFVLCSVAESVRRIYDELSMTPGPSSSARTRARRKGWPPPLAWDEDKIDDPDARPDGIVELWQRDKRKQLDETKVRRRIAGDKTGRLSVAETDEVVRRLNAEGLDDGQISERTGISRRTVLRARNRLGLPAIPQFLIDVPA